MLTPPDRKDTRNMLCMHCSTPQPAAQYCQNCQIRLARYYCEKVRFPLPYVSDHFSAIYGTILPRNQSTTVLIVVYAALERALERTFSTARFGSLNFP